MCKLAGALGAPDGWGAFCGFRLVLDTRMYPCRGNSLSCPHFVCLLFYMLYFDEVLFKAREKLCEVHKVNVKTVPKHWGDIGTKPHKGVCTSELTYKFSANKLILKLVRNTEQVSKQESPGNKQVMCVWGDGSKFGWGGPGLTRC